MCAFLRVCGYECVCVLARACVRVRVCVCERERGMIHLGGLLVRRLLRE